ncbi:hypothetical protein EI94DRAFT_1757092, partial [Lactarius quietus]
LTDLYTYLRMCKWPMAIHLLLRCVLCASWSRVPPLSLASAHAPWSSNKRMVSVCLWMTLGAMESIEGATDVKEVLKWSQGFDSNTVQPYSTVSLAGTFKVALFGNIMGTVVMTPRRSHLDSASRGCPLSTRTRYRPPRLETSKHRRR